MRIAVFVVAWIPILLWPQLSRAEYDPIYKVDWIHDRPCYSHAALKNRRVEALGTSYRVIGEIENKSRGPIKNVQVCLHQDCASAGYVLDPGQKTEFSILTAEEHPDTIHIEIHCSPLTLSHLE